MTIIHDTSRVDPATVATDGDRGSATDARRR